MTHDHLRDRLSEGSTDESNDSLPDEERHADEGTDRQPSNGPASPGGGTAGSSEGGQISETDSLHGGGAPIEPSDSVAGGPDGESGTPQEGTQGPDAPTFAEDKSHYVKKDDVDTTG
jgi:hypothetical protein